MVLIKDIRLVSFCEHHLLPVVGQAHVAYIPNGKVIGLSKIPRVVDVLAKRPQMQERLTEELADLLMKELDAKGVAVVIEASHSCMTIRGVKKPESTFVTSAMRGVFKERLATRSGSHVADLRIASDESAPSRWPSWFTSEQPFGLTTDPKSPGRWIGRRDRPRRDFNLAAGAARLPESFFFLRSAGIISSSLPRASDRSELAVGIDYEDARGSH